MFAGKEEITCYLLYKSEDNLDDNDGDVDEGGEVHDRGTLNPFHFTHFSISKHIYDTVYFLHLIQVLSVSIFSPHCNT